MKVNKHLSALRRALLLIAILLLQAIASSAQESGQATEKDNPSSQNTTKDSTSSEPASPIGLVWADSYIHQIGSSGLLAGTREGIGWGSLYIPSASATGIVDRLEGTGTQQGIDYESAIFQTSIIYDHRLSRNTRLAVQYAPSMAIANGQVVGNFSNQNTSVDLLVYARPRWNVRFRDTFSYYYTQQAYGFPYFDVNPATAGSVTNNFLNGPSRWLSDASSMSVGYAFSRRTSIAVSPSFVYSESGTGTNLTHAVSYGGSVNLDYRTGERQTVGIQYTGQLIHETLPAISILTTGLSSDTLFHNVAGTLARQLSATWTVRGSAGFTTTSYSQSIQNTRQWSFYGSFGLVKQLGRSSLGLNYFRGDTLSNGLISNLYADRVDGTYKAQMGRRCNWSIGGGYLRQVQSGGFSGWYSSGDVQYLLAPRAGLFSFFDYIRNNQSTNTNNLYSGNRDLFSFGIRWQPGRVAH